MIAGRAYCSVPEPRHSGNCQDMVRGLTCSFQGKFKTIRQFANAMFSLIWGPRKLPRATATRKPIIVTQKRTLHSSHSSHSISRRISLIFSQGVQMMAHVPSFCFGKRKDKSSSPWRCRVVHRAGILYYHRNWARTKTA
jgi:hypothetical protein